MKFREIQILRIGSYAVISVLLLTIFEPEVHSSYCPDFICDCVFDDVVLTENSAICRRNGTMTMGWQISGTTESRPLLTITCEDVKKWSLFDTPQFNVENYQMRVISCPSNVLRCFDQLRAKLEKLYVEDLIGGYSSKYFAGLNGLNEMTMKLKDTDALPVAAISPLTTLTELHLDGGNFDLRQNTFRFFPKLKIFELKNNNISAIPLHSLNGLRCVVLKISNNKIQNVSLGTFKNLGYIKELHITDSQLQKVTALGFSSRTLEYLRLEKNLIEFLPNGFLVGLPQLENVQILENKVDITLDSHVFSQLPMATKMIELYNSKLHNLTETLFSKSIYLQILKMHGTEIEEFPAQIFYDLVSLTHLDLSGNLIKYIPEGFFEHLTVLDTLNLNSNRLTALSDNQFSFSPNLKMLMLNQNLITSMNVNSFNGTHLQRLTLLGNDLETIYGDTNLIWKDIEKLDLSANKLRTFEDIIYGLPNLIEVNLSRNEITAIRENNIYFLSINTSIDLRRNQISHVIRDPSPVKEDLKGGRIGLYLSNNSLQCDCSLVTVFHEWSKAGFLRRFEDVTCSDEQILSKIDVYLFCNKQHALIALIGSCIVGALIILVLLISILTQWNKIWSYIMDVYHRVESNDPESIDIGLDEDKPYDVFISFAHQDEVFVTDQLMPILESDFGLKVCVHYRDWTVGDLIPDQIKESVLNSKMTVIILTEHFLESEWSYLEFRTAHDLSIEDGKSRIILVLLDEQVTRDEKLTSDFKLYISTNTYLIWDDPKFWGKLKKVLPKGAK